MQRRTRLLATITILLAFIIPSTKALEKIKMNVNPNSDMALYAQSLLRLALSQQHTYQLETIHNDTPVQRDIDMVKFNELDIVWHPTNRQLEKQLLAIRVPIAKGLLGYQSVIVKKQRLPEFSIVNQRKLLETLSFGVSRNTGDKQIYLSAGLTGVYSSNEQTLIHMLEGERFDYLPTETHKAHKLVLDNPKLNLVVVPDLVVSFIKPIYFFVNQNDIQLAMLLSERLEHMVNDGTLDDLLLQQTFAAYTINKLSNEKMVAIELTNPVLPEKTPVADSRYWYQFEADEQSEETLLSSL
ncbi:transporter substrate-binding domain-containing protein [Catenovulum agarivorans]|uniref:transporter substrate-binding domain-containing protein n=1 Tax=Catenovulum agarivorans TaxID=1172192 RepID=UPI00036FDA91|nr:transporter substrate-binding domain-containing protein [Catenovulum agarivorans]